MLCHILLACLLAGAVHDVTSLLHCASSPITMIGTVVFGFGNVLQHVSHVHLARLREVGKKGGAISDGASHYLPTWGKRIV